MKAKDAKAYTTEVVECEPNAHIEEVTAALFSFIEAPRGTFHLVPTQGKLIHLGSFVLKKGLGEVWAYLRYHRYPIYIARINTTWGQVVEKLAEEEIEEGARYGVKARQMSMEIADRRHYKIDPAYETPGKSSKEIGFLELMHPGIFRKSGYPKGYTSRQKQPANI